MQLLKLFLKARTKNATSIRIVFAAITMTMNVTVAQANYSVTPKYQGCCVTTIVAKGVTVWVTQP